MEAHLQAEYAPDWKGNDESALERAAGEAWEALPEEVRAYCRPVDGHIVLICGDGSWSNFPWEGLKTGPGALDVLGMRMPLVRHASLDPASFSALAGVVIGGSARAAAVVCPWDVPPAPLPSARDEADAVAGILVRNGYAGAAGTLLRLGYDAGAEGMAQAIAARPDVLHYCGHGMVRHGEEVLALRGDGAAVPFGRREVDSVLVQAGLAGTPRPGLAVLNCCFGGRVRSHGGRREDLVAAMMRADAAVVVASAMPLDDVSAAVLGVCIHHPAGRGDETVGDIVMRARRIVAACAREAGLPAWPAWTHVTCHGNPLAVYRRGGGSTTANGEADALAEQIVGVLDPADHERPALTARVREIVHTAVAGA